ncbi:MAG: hypothetical protein R2826_11715 [Thermoleophilia bacterium]
MPRRNAPLKSGNKAPKTAIYKSGSKQVVVNKGETLPPTAKGGTWKQGKSLP